MAPVATAPDRYRSAFESLERQGALQAPAWLLPVRRAAIARFEQLYPFPTDDLRALLAKYPLVRGVRWVQEEPSNMGAWNFVLEKLRERLPEGTPLTCVARPRSGSPATGSQAMHAVEQEILLQEALLG